MTRKPIAYALCLVLCPLLAAQQVGQAEAKARGVTPAETLFAYRSSMNLPAQLGFEPVHADSSDSLYGLAIVPFKVPIKLTQSTRQRGRTRRSARLLHFGSSKTSL